MIEIDKVIDLNILILPREDERVSWDYPPLGTSALCAVTSETNSDADSECSSNANSKHSSCQEATHSLHHFSATCSTDSPPLALIVTPTITPMIATMLTPLLSPTQSSDMSSNGVSIEGVMFLHFTSFSQITIELEPDIFINGVLK